LWEADALRPGAKSQGFRLFICLGSSLLPWALRRRLLNGLFGWDIAEDARIGFSAISAERVQLGPGSRIGHFTVCRGLENLVVGPNAIIGKANWITGSLRGGPYFGDDRSPELVLERDASIAGQHVIDCTDQVYLGQFATLGGWRSQVLTHAIDFESNRQTCAPVLVGEYSFVGTQVVVLPGATIPPRSVVAAGSVVVSGLAEERVTYAGAPAKRIKALTGDERYFARMTGPVD
jgi:acetyltransferase-like isoleucine patch superfamily enzyme